MPRENSDPTRVERSTLENGATFVRQPAPKGAASFAATYVGPAGFAYDPPGSEGMALLTTELLTSGAGRWDRRALDRELDRLGATLTRRCHPECHEVTIWGPGSEWTRLLEILAAVVLSPRLEASDLDRERRQVLERQLRELSQPDSRAERELGRLVFAKGHPYRSTGLGTRASVARLRRSDLVRFHRTHCAAPAALLVTTGRPGSNEVARRLEATFDEWPSARPPALPTTPPDVAPPPTATRIPMPGRSQVEVRMGGVSLPRSAPGYAGVFLANEVLGGRPILSRLFQNVRERRGLAYHASSEVQGMKWGGYWTAAAGTGPERVEETVKVLAAEVRRIAEEPVTAAELDRIRESAIGELPLQLETTSGAHELAVDVGYHGLPVDFVQTWPGELRRLTPREVREAAAVGLNGRTGATVIAGPI